MNKAPEKAPCGFHGFNMRRRSAAEVIAAREPLGSPCRQLHDLAMELAGAADDMSRHGTGAQNEQEAARTFCAAAAAEMAAGLLVPSEPARSILLRSAAWLALQGAQPEWAAIIARIGLREAGPAGEPCHPAILPELQDVLALAEKAIGMRPTTTATERPPPHCLPCTGCKEPIMDCICGESQ